MQVAPAFLLKKYFLKKRQKFRKCSATIYNSLSKCGKFRIFFPQNLGTLVTRIFFPQKNYLYPAVQDLFLSLRQQKLFATVKKRTIGEELPTQNTHVLFFRRNFHTAVTKRNSSATCSKGALWNIFAPVAIFGGKNSWKSGSWRLPEQNAILNIFYFSGLTFSQILAHSSSEY